MTTSCIYDNPATWTRQMWMDGRMICSLSAKILLQREPRWPWRRPPPAAWRAPWQPGQIQGDPKALPEAKP
jgi:hypothetical protein